MTTTDPRERLIAAGNRLLDALYASETFNAEHAEVLALLKAGRNEEAVAILNQTGSFADVLIQSMTISSNLKSASAEYVALRATIDAFAH